MARPAQRLGIAFLLSFALLAPEAAARPPAKDSPLVLVLPLPSQDPSPAEQDQVIGLLAGQLRRQFGVRVLAGRAVERAVFGTKGTGLAEAAAAFDKRVQEGKRAYQLLQIGKAQKALEQARTQLERCGPEVRDAQRFVDLYLFSGLALLATGKTEEAAAEFRQAVAMDPGLTLSPKQYPPDVLRSFDKAKRGLLSGRPANVQFLSKPRGAEVFLDGRSLGQTPINAVPVFPGSHFVRFELEGHSVWTLNLPAGVAPSAIRAQMVPQWSGDPPEDLMAQAIARDELGEPVRALLKLMAGFYRVDAVLLVSIGREGRETHFGARLVTLAPENFARARLFNLGPNPKGYDRKLQGIVGTLRGLKGLRRAAAASAAPATPEPGDTSPGVPLAPPPAVATGPLDPIERPVPIDEQVAPEGFGTPWYKTWWFWTITGVVVAGAAAGVTVWLLQPEGSWTLVLQPGS